MLDRLFSDREVEKITRRARPTLQKDRVSGRGIPFVRIGRLVRYRESDVENFIASLQTRHSTSECDTSSTSRDGTADTAVPKPQLTAAPGTDDDELKPVRWEPERHPRPVVISE